LRNKGIGKIQIQAKGSAHSKDVEKCTDKIKCTNTNRNADETCSYWKLINK